MSEDFTQVVSEELTSDEPARREVELTLAHVDAWSVAKSAFMLGVTIAGVLIVAVIALWLMLSSAGVFDAVIGLFRDVSGDQSAGVSFLSLQRLVGLAMVVSAVEIVLLSGLATLFAMLYNLAVGLTGGITVTLADKV
jgi:hypothetical protein